MQDSSQQSQFSKKRNDLDPLVVGRTPSHRLPCEQMAYIPDDDDDDDGPNNEFTPVTLPNVEETVCTYIFIRFI